MTNVAPQFSAPAAKSRPGTVTAAVATQILVFVLAVAGAVLTLSYGSDVTDAMRASLEEQGAAPDVVNSVSGGNDMLSMSVTGVLAIAYLVLAFFNLRGVNGARITTWVLSGLMLLCSLIGVGFMTLLGGGAGNIDGVDFAEATEAGLAAVPAWYNGFTTVSLIASTLGYLLVIILLALPASNEFFRKDPQPQQIVLPGDNA